MHMLFLDESGTPPRPQDNQPNYFVVGGIVIPETSWRRMRDGLMGIKIRRRLRGEINWRFFSPTNQDERNPMRQLEFAERNAIRAEIYQLINSDPAVRTIACVASREAAYAMPAVTSQTELYHATFKPLTERFQYHLQDVSRASGTKQYGIIVGDHRGARDDQHLRKHHEKLIHSASGFTSNYPNLIEGLFIHPSHLSVGIQLADMVAGAVWRKFERRDDACYEMLRPSLRKGPSGEEAGFGIVKFPKAGFI